MYDIFSQLCKSRGVSVRQVALACGIATSTMSEWKSGRSVPKMDKMQRIADYFGVSLDYLLGREEPDESYYKDPDSRKAAEFLFKNPGYKVLFDASSRVRPEDIVTVKKLIDAINERQDG